MYSSKQTILETVALLKAHDVKCLVISPGSRNAPLIQSFISDPFFTCYSVLDERSASYVAIGLIHQLRKPIALCCTSGSAVLNYGPAIAEACYQHLPLVILSADRTPAWINQLDGQTIPQTDLFPSLLKKTVQLPEVVDAETRWHCNRLINEALLVCRQNGGGPVQLNIPIAEPLFDFGVKDLPHVRKITQSPSTEAYFTESMASTWHTSKKRLIVVGQLPNQPELERVLESLVLDTDCVVLCEHLSNLDSDCFIRNFDALLGFSDEHTRAQLLPDLLITLGGHLVSKLLRKWLRSNPSFTHWHISPDNTMPDTFQGLSDRIEGEPSAFLHQLNVSVKKETETAFSSMWKRFSSAIPVPSTHLPFSDVVATGLFLDRLPRESTLFVANSSPVRNIHLFHKPSIDKIVCNRGTNGIEGSVSTAIGLSLSTDKPAFALMGDLSFFHDLSGLWSTYGLSNLRILLINNGGGGIFHQLEGLDLSPSLEAYVAANHNRSAEKWVESAGLIYLKATNLTELNEQLTVFMRSNSESGIVLEVMTTPENNKKAMQLYQNGIKQALS